MTIWFLYRLRYREALWRYVSVRYYKDIQTKLGDKLSCHRHMRYPTEMQLSSFLGVTQLDVTSLVDFFVGRWY